jgi:hypothetical protein
MSVTDDKRSELGQESEKRLHPVRDSLRRPVVVGVMLAVTAVAVVGGALWINEPERNSLPPTPPTTAPLTLPDTITDLTAGPDAVNFAAQPTWINRAKAAAPGAVVTGRAYGSPQLRRQIRVAAGRGDLTGKLEFAWAADAGRTIKSPLGVAHCTKNLILAAGSKPSVRPTMVLCWRVSPTLSAYGVVIDFDHHPADSEGMAALDAAWKAALTGR